MKTVVSSNNHSLLQDNILDGDNVGDDSEVLVPEPTVIVPEPAIMVPETPSHPSKE